MWCSTCPTCPVEEGFTYHWRHTHEEVIDAAAEVINLLLGDRAWPFDFLVENQWWPGFTFTMPALTRCLLDGIQYENKGIMLDTGHLMNANLELRTQEEGADWVSRMLEEHGGLGSMVRGIHLHQSLSGAYVKAHTGSLPDPWPVDYAEQFCQSYQHILSIDTHRPWTTPAVRALVERIAPEWLVHELSAANRAERDKRLEIQSPGSGRSLEKKVRWGRGARGCVPLPLGKFPAKGLRNIDKSPRFVYNSNNVKRVTRKSGSACYARCAEAS